MRPNMLNVNWIDGRIALSVPAHGTQDSLEIWNTFNGTTIPSVLAANYSEGELVRLVHEIHQSVPVVSVALGNSGDPKQWNKALHAVDGNQTHLNQPAIKAGFACGYASKASWNNVWINGVVEPTGVPGIVRVPLATSRSESITLPIDSVTTCLYECGVTALKIHPVGNCSKEELITIARSAFNAGIEAAEPAGGITLKNFNQITDALFSGGIRYVLPHVFSAVEDSQTGLVIHEKIRDFIRLC